MNLINGLSADIQNEKGEYKMSEIEVRIIKLDPMRVASIWGFGEQPENIAFQKLEPWATSRGIRNNPDEHRIFGFNNPDPHPGSPNYGYEIWVEVDAEERIVAFHRAAPNEAAQCEDEQVAPEEKTHRPPGYEAS